VSDRPISIFSCGPRGRDKEKRSAGARDSALAASTPVDGGDRYGPEGDGERVSRRFLRCRVCGVPGRGIYLWGCLHITPERCRGSGFRGNRALLQDHCRRGSGGKGEVVDVVVIGAYGQVVGRR